MPKSAKSQIRAQELKEKYEDYKKPSTKKAPKNSDCSSQTQKIQEVLLKKLLENPKYHQVLCEHDSRGHCHYSDDECLFAHGNHNLICAYGAVCTKRESGECKRLHPVLLFKEQEEEEDVQIDDSIKKTKWCTYFTKYGECRYGDECDFAHEYCRCKHGENCTRRSDIDEPCKFLHPDEEPEVIKSIMEKRRENEERAKREEEEQREREKNAPVLTWGNKPPLKIKSMIKPQAQPQAQDWDALPQTSWAELDETKDDLQEEDSNNDSQKENGMFQETHLLSESLQNELNSSQTVETQPIAIPKKNKKKPQQKKASEEKLTSREESQLYKLAQNLNFPLTLTQEEILLICLRFKKQQLKSSIDEQKQQLDHLTKVEQVMLSKTLFSSKKHIENPQEEIQENTHEEIQEDTQQAQEVVV